MFSLKITFLVLLGSKSSTGFLPQSCSRRGGGWISHSSSLLGRWTADNKYKLSVAAALADVSSNDTSIESSTSAAPSTSTSNESSISPREQIRELASLVSSATSYELAVRSALAAQRLFEQEDPTSYSLNSVLVIWSRVAQKLSEWHNNNNNSNNSLDIGVSTSSANIDDAASSSTLGDYLKDVNVREAAVYTTKDAAVHAQSLLDQHLHLATTNSFNAVMDCWTKSRDETAPDQVQALFDQIQNPDESSFNALVEAYAYSRDVPMRITKLERLNVKYSDSSRSCNALLHAYSKAAQENPRAATEISKKALAALDALKETYQRTNDPMQRPDIMSYTTVIDCLGKTGRLQYAQIADQLMKEAKEGCKNTTAENRFRPTVFTFTTLIRTWGRMNTEETIPRCLEILDESIEWIGPHVNVFTSIIQVLSKTNKVKQPAEKALQLLQRMRSLSVEPTIMTYNSALEACSKQGTEGAANSLKIAFAIFKAIEQPSSGVEPNEWTFAALMGCVAKLLPASDERNKIASIVFRKAAAAQMVSKRLLQQTINACDSSAFYELLCHDMMPNNSGKFDFDAIPPKWSKRAAPEQ